jgi:hypothetical protein
MMGTSAVWPHTIDEIQSNRESLMHDPINFDSLPEGP